jgi:hypothetical protein
VAVVFYSGYLTLLLGQGIYHYCQYAGRVNLTTEFGG